MPPLTTCLWFDGRANEAADFYLSIFPNSSKTTSNENDSHGFIDEDSVMIVNFEINGSPFMALNGGPMYQFSPATSFVVSCADQDEIDHYWNALLDGGTAMQCGWLTDKFGVSWQIIPSRLGELMSSSDSDSAARVMQAMLQMVKLDISALESAAISA